MTEKTTKKDLTGQRILAEAEAQVAEFGVGNVSVRTIAKALGIGVSTLYYTYAATDDLVLAVNSRTIAILDDILASAAEDAKDQPVAVLFEKLALAYLHFAIDHPNRFAALFEHRMAKDAPIPEWHLQDLYRLFRHVEAPLSGLNRNLGEDERRILARTIFSSVHGIVQLGLQGRMIALPVPVIEQQLRVITQVLATGLFSVVGR